MPRDEYPSFREMLSTILYIIQSFIASVFVTAIVFAILFGGYDLGVSSMERDAVERGHAEYVIGEDGKHVWQWKPIDVSPPAPVTDSMDPTQPDKQEQ